MTMRKLTEEELDKTNKGITRIEKENVDLKDNIEFNEKTIAFQKAQAEYNDFARPYLKKKKEIEDKKTMELMYQNLKSNEYTISTLRSHVKDGVEIKEDKYKIEEVGE